MAGDDFDLGLIAQSGLGGRRYGDGEKIFTSGDPGEAMYVVTAGQVDIIRYGTVLENVRPGGFFGEMALIDGEPRSASAIAHGETEIVSVDEAGFRQLVQQQPGFALTVMRRLAVRLRRISDQI